jgi:sec-independent protein translocase protein TatB
MSGVGFSELIILALIGLIVLGPERLPRVARQMGNWIGQARRMTRVMRRQLEDELDFDEDLNPKTKSGIKKSDVLNPKSAAQASTPHDDDTYSPLHVEQSNALSATVDELTSGVAEETSGNESESDSDSDATKKPVDDETEEKSA